VLQCKSIWLSSLTVLHCKSIWLSFNGILKSF